jgi:hypothetical protein
MNDKLSEEQMTFRKHASLSALVLSLPFVFLSCSDSGDDTAPDAGQDPCTKFQSYAESCDITGTNLNYLNLACNMMDKFFIESFMSEMTDCFSSDSCDELSAVLSSLDGTDAGSEIALDAGVFDNPIITCAASAVVNIEPEQTNLNFKKHFCDYTVACNDDLSRTQCEDRFTAPGEMFLFTALDTPYITDADACVYPAPDCSEADKVTECLEDVTASMTAFLDILGK